MFKSETVPWYGFQATLPGVQTADAGHASHESSASMLPSGKQCEAEQPNIGTSTATTVGQHDTNTLFQGLSNITSDIPTLIQAMQLRRVKSPVPQHRINASERQTADGDDTSAQMRQLSSRISDVEVLLQYLKKDIEGAKIARNPVTNAIESIAIETLQHEMMMLKPSVFELQADMEKVYKIVDDAGSTTLNQQVEISEVRGQVAELLKTTVVLQQAVREQQPRKHQDEPSAAYTNQMQMQIDALFEEDAKNLQQVRTEQKHGSDQLYELARKVRALEVMVTSDRVRELECKLQAKAPDMNYALPEALPSSSIGFCETSKRMEQLDEKLSTLNSYYLSLTQQHQRLASEITGVQMHLEQLNAPSLMRSFGEMLVVGQDSCTIFFVNALKGYAEKDESGKLDEWTGDMKQWVLNQTEALAQCLERQLKVEKRLCSAEREVSAIPLMNKQIRQLEKVATQSFVTHPFDTRTARSSQAASPVRRFISSQAASPVRKASSPVRWEVHQHDQTGHDMRSASCQDRPCSSDANPRSRAACSEHATFLLNDVQGNPERAPSHPPPLIASRPHDRPLFIRSTSVEGLHHSSQHSAVPSSPVQSRFGQQVLQTSASTEQTLLKRNPYPHQRTPRIQPVVRTLVGHVRLQPNVPDGGSPIVTAAPCTFPGSDLILSP